MNQPLSSQETERGHNVLKEVPEKNALQRFLAQLNDPLIFILFIAASISMLLGEYSDTLIILSVILVNALVGVIQEGKAQRALHALKEMSSPKALLIKDSETRRNSPSVPTLYPAMKCFWMPADRFPPTCLSPNRTV